MAIVDVYLKIEAIEDYSPVEPQDKTAPPIRYQRDGMRNMGHEDGTIPDAERDARALRAVVYRQYLDPQYLVPNTAKLVPADINEPIYDRRVPGCVLWAEVGDDLHIHVLNADNVPHSFHIHGIEYGIDSDGAWPMGTQATDGRRSDEICPGQTWTYRFHVAKDMVGAWPFHDHSSHAATGSVKLGLFGGLIVTEPRKGGHVPPKLPEGFVDSLEGQLGKLIGKRATRADALPAPAKQIWQDHLEFLREWHFRDQLGFKLPERPRGPLHIPVFFHQMLSKDAKPVFDSGDLEENGLGTYSHQFDVAGTFDYFCAFHPMMTGTVEVVSGAPANVSVNILDAPAMGFSPQTVQVAPGGMVDWTNQSVQHHTVTSSQGAAMATHSINGRGFVGNSPTVVALAGRKLRWYIFNLDFDHEWHNFHPHDQRWQFAGENYDVRSMGPAESFVVETTAPKVLLLPPEVEAIQDPDCRPKDAKRFRLMGDYVFHCHVHHHMMNGMIGIVRSYQDVWLTAELKEQLEAERGLQLYDPSNPIPDVDPHRCKKQGPGEWEELTLDPEVTFMHACLLPNTDKVLYWGYTRADQSRLFDPAGPTVTAPANQPADLPGMDANLSDLWSSEHALLDDANGTLLAHGGFAGNGGINSFRSFLFDPTTEAWSATGDTDDFRFYSSTITLADGTPMTLFGSASKSAEVFDPAGGTWSTPDAFPASMYHHQYYPWTYLLPDGKLFIAGPHDPTHRFDRDPIANVESFPMIAGNRSTGGEKGTSVLLPLRPPNHEAVVLSIGGNTPSSDQTAEMIDLSDANPAWTGLPNLNIARSQQVNSVLLPDGSVMVAGGASGLPDGGPVELLDSTNPGAGWTLGPTMQHARGYHSAMILLADGSVLFGGDPNSGVFERFYPGYCNNARPTITNAPDTASHGSSITVDTPEAPSIAEVTLMRPGAVTHGFNMAQRSVVCEVSGGDATSLDIDITSNANVLPPGWYLIFVVDGFKIPSHGRWIRITA